MTDLEVYNFPVTGQPVRSFLRNDAPWFIGRDACAVLEIAKPESSLALLDEDEKDTHTVGTPGGPQVVTVISESGLYSLILRSRKPEAKAFKRWITHEVLPEIRKTGGYRSNGTALDINDPRAVIVLAQAAERSAVMLIEERRLRAETEAQLAVAAPKAAQADFHRAADGLVAIGDFANKVKAWAKGTHDVRILHQDVWNFLGDINLLIRGNTVRHNQPTAFAIERGYVLVKETEFETNTRGPQAATSPRLTPAGEGYAWDRAVKRIADHGSLAPITAVAIPTQSLPSERS